MKYTGKIKGFTLIELIVVISIIAIISLASYFPYAHHQKKVLLKQASREIAQSFSEARNFSLNGLNTGSGNLNVGLYIPQTATFLAYYTSTGAFDLGTLTSAALYKTKQLPKGIQIDSIDGNNTDYLFTFEAINGNLVIDPVIANREFDIQTSYKGASTATLQQIIRYYTTSHILDY